MAKPDPALLDPARYPFSCTIETRFSDLDVNMHINHVALAGMVEDGRVRFHQKIGYSDLLVNQSSMVANLQVDFLGEGQYPAAIAVHSAVGEVGRTSHRIINLVTQDGRLIALAQTTIVAVGPDGPSPLPDRFRQAIPQWMLRA
ncbi:hypothetical protein GCM10011494_23310 [Novosphingobium endophyticum]|uniref:Thioesterase n=1 Tax=Novosphingobium endophyticum TaxID=1955250 RepID=A0A916TTC0_9SPHN|nr:acyl-CoA thioesterase [Novosphingobium endophyticum]GGC04179.1 hypothetical protein GCM10011494_23310 [Novosphingobium endophyticum]